MLWRKNWKGKKVVGMSFCNQARSYGTFLGQNPMGPSWDRHLPHILCFSFSLKYLYSMLSCFSCVWLFCDPMDCSLPAPLSMRFSRQEYWNGLPFPSPGDLPDPGVELTSPALQVDSLPLSHQGSPLERLELIKEQHTNVAPGTVVIILLDGGLLFSFYARFPVNCT